MPHRTLPIVKIIGLSLFLGFLAAPVIAKFMRGTSVPIARLLTNVGRYVKENPNNADGHYILGRLHGLAFANSLPEVEVLHVERAADLPTLANGVPLKPSLTLGEPKPAAKLLAQRTKHLQESIREYRKATGLASKEGLYFLGLAWVLEQGADFIEKFTPVGLGKGDQPATWRKEAIADYRKAYQLAAPLALKGGDIGPGDSIAEEAGEDLLRLAAKMPNHGINPIELRQVRLNLKKISNRPHYVTPILFPFERNTPLSELIDTIHSVKFDLAATGRADRWPWVNAKAGILVWDPNKTGKITSGQQLFGSRTWQMFWKNGYEPLAALDNNGDGWLTGTELTGIAVWRDVNGNGRSERGEVVPVEKMGIVGICVCPDGMTEGVPSNAEGIRMQDGKTLPTYDWTPVSVPPRQIKGLARAGHSLESALHGN
jgi:hypothetical protein